MLQVTIWSRIAMTLANDFIPKPSFYWLATLSSYFILTEFVPFIVIILWVNSRQKKQTYRENDDIQSQTMQRQNSEFSDQPSNFQMQKSSHLSDLY